MTKLTNEHKENDVEDLNTVVESINAKIAAITARLEANARAKNGGRRRPKSISYRLLKTRIDWAETPQMLTVVEILKAIGAEKEPVPITLVEAAMEKNVGLFDITGEKQTPTRVWRYYRKELLDHEVLEEVKPGLSVVLL